MKLGKELGIIPIKLNTKYSNKEIDSILERVNEILYFFNFLYYNSRVAEYVKQNIANLGQQLKNISISTESSAAKNAFF